MGNQSYDRPTKKPKLTYYHEQYGNVAHSDSFNSITADDINERIPVFADTDAGRRPDLPPQTAICPRRRRLRSIPRSLHRFST